jgi:tetratricopeptide (TPR) repeat protein
MTDRKEASNTTSGSKARRPHPGQPPASKEPPLLGPNVFLLVVCTIVVAGVVTGAHWPVLSAQAVSFDDEEAILHNPLVQNPSWPSVKRFFGEVTLSSVVPGYYRPLTLTALMLDWAMGGRPENFRPFHRTSLALHVASTVLIILLCYQVFRQPIIAALVGLLFGVHPLTVEPIAWVMERKTVLAAFFAFACLNAYLRYTRGLRWPWLAAALVLYLLSLLAKPTATPLPIILLLMDYWPLKRLRRRAVLEKIPFFVLSAAFAALCVLCEQKVNPLSLPARLGPLHLPLRLCWLIGFYPCKILLPIHLSSVYMLPQPLNLADAAVLLAVAGTVALIGFLIASRRWTPALWAGAAMFYVGLTPTMGFVGYSWVVASDKYVYLPAVGLLLILAWALERIWSGGTEGTRRVRQVATVAVVLVAVGLLGLGTRRYLSHWQTTVGLCNYMLALAPNAYPLYFNRGNAYNDIHDFGRAIHDYTKAIELRADFAKAYNNRGNTYDNMRDHDRAIRDYTKAIELKPDYAEAYNNRGKAYKSMGDLGQAIRDYAKAIELKPDLAQAYNNRGNAYKSKGDSGQANRDYARAIELNPDYAEAYYNRANNYSNMGDSGRAIQDYAKAIELKPDYAEAYHNRAIAHFYLKEYDHAWADVRMCRRLGGTPSPGLVKRLAEATGRTE